MGGAGDSYGGSRQLVWNSTNSPWRSHFGSLSVLIMPWEGKVALRAHVSLSLSYHLFLLFKKQRADPKASHQWQSLSGFVPLLCII